MLINYNVCGVMFKGLVLLSCIALRTIKVEFFYVDRMLISLWINIWRFVMANIALLLLFTTKNHTTMKKISINLYSFAELSEQSKQRAIQEHLEFLDNTPEQYENENGELVNEYLEHQIHEAIESIEMNEYIFYFNGEMVDSITYVGGHPLAGIIDVIIHGEKFSFSI